MNADVKPTYFGARRVAPSDPQRTTVNVGLSLALPQDKNAKILDVGCGFGGNLFALRSEGYTNIQGIDLDVPAVEFCVANGLNVRLSDARALSQDKAGYYDLVVMNHVLEHIPKAQMVDVLRDIRALLAPGGRLFVAVPNAQANTGAYWAFEDFTHEFLFTSGSLYYVARMAGYRDVDYLDVDCTAGTSTPMKIFRRVFLKLYDANRKFWNKVTRSSYHTESPNIYSYEIKALLKP